MLGTFALETVYYVSSTDAYFNPIAICPNFKIKNNGKVQVSWDDTTGEVVCIVVDSTPPITGEALSTTNRKLESIKESLATAQKIELVISRDLLISGNRRISETQHVVLQPLTKEIFLQRVQPIACGGVDVTSTETIRNHYMTHSSFGMF